MKILRTIEGMRRHAAGLRRRHMPIGFVPTMGALHQGHLSLMRMASRQCPVVLVSIFVNPSQFGPHEDYARYPRNLKGDAKKCRTAGVDILFAPTALQLYPHGFKTWVSVKEIGDVLEGHSRPGHFSGMATIVLKLFNIIRPHRAYFGLKDHQQAAVIRRLVKDLNLDTKIVLGPTIREPDGLAMSSRNRYLSRAERRAAPILWKALQSGREAVRKGVNRASNVRSAMIRRIVREPMAKIDYVTVADPETLNKISEIRGPVLIALAVWIGQTRLIDNIIVRPH